MTEEEKRHLSAEYRKTAHDGEFEFKVAGRGYSLSNQEAIEELEKRKEELLKEIAASPFADSFFGKKKTMMKSKVLDAVLGFVVGDALGVPIEFESRKELSVNPLRDMIGYGSHKVPEGTWSDDTSMMLATMDSIINNNGIDYDDIMNNFCEWYMNSKYTATGVMFDIGISTCKALQKFYSGTSALDCGGKGDFDNGNGSLMRILPISLYSFSNNLDETQEIELLNDCSSLTHGHEISRLGCKIYTDYIKAILNGKNKKEAFYEISNKDYSRNYSKDSIDKYKRLFSRNFENLDISQIKSSGYIVDTLEASLWCVLNTQGYEETVVKAINLGDDTDTVGAITGSIAGLIYGNENIPERWTSKLKGKEYLSELIDNYSKCLSNKSNDFKNNNVNRTINR